MTIRKPGVELKAYIQWQNKWRHVYIISSYDQTTLSGDPVRMLQFKLSKKSVDTLAAEKSKFHKNKPAPRRSRAERVQ